MEIKENTILIATKNKGKIKEFENMFKDTNIKIKTLYDYPLDDIEETGSTFFENALIKAKAGYNVSNLLTIADDSGLEVDSLDKKPGVYSARFGGNGLTDKERLFYLLEQMKDIKNRTARFKTSIVLYNGENEIEEFNGIWEGEILNSPVGENGFGYDPIFYDKNLKLSAAQLTPEEKRSISHRGKAMKLFFEKFKGMI
jgi:XTP/dITP diphosphohydrolase